MQNKYVILLAIYCFTSCSIIGQQTIDMNRVNESVKGSLIETNLGNEIIKEELSKYSDSLKNEIHKLSDIVVNFNKFIDAINDDLIAKAGGMDTNYSGQRPVLYKDRNIPKQLFIIEGKGSLLKNKIDTTRQQILNFIDAKYIAELSKLIPLTTDDSYSNNMTWWDRKFKDMPVAAVMPSLTILKHDANTSERIILDYWRLKYK
jgi:GldM N-terminal domain